VAAKTGAAPALRGLSGGLLPHPAYKLDVIASHAPAVANDVGDLDQVAALGYQGGDDVQDPLFTGLTDLSPGLKQHQPIAAY